jgi:hypothetical protein
MQIEEMDAVRFILLAGLVGGALQSLPLFFVSGSVRIPIALLLVSTFYVLWWGAAMLLWWAAVRRRRFTIWMAAVHVTLALIVAGVLELLLSAVTGSIETRGAFAQMLVRAPLSGSLVGLELVLVRIPFWFLGSAMLVAIGRRLPGIGDSAASQAAS